LRHSRRHRRFVLSTFGLRTDCLRQIRESGEKIGFAIGAKQQKPVAATDLIRDNGSRGAAQKWLQLYEKRNGRWTKRAMESIRVTKPSISQKGTKKRGRRGYLPLAFLNLSSTFAQLTTSHHLSTYAPRSFLYCK
jgi:hypothetical protein